MSDINTGFAKEIRKYGAKDFEACFSCGNCTATCNLTGKNAAFPRMLIRYGVLGLKQDILNSKELWLCYACGECTDNCPRQAAPGEYMAALRRYAIAGYEPTGLTKLIFKSNPFSIILTLVLAILLGFFLLTIRAEQEVSRWIFNYVPYEVIHNTGLVIFIITGLSMVWGITAMVLHLRKQNGGGIKNFFGSFSKMVSELSTLKRYSNCDEEEDSFWNSKPSIKKPWFVHWSIMWGFIGLLVATSLDFIFKDPAIKSWWPTRLLGTLSGLLLVYGTSMAMNYRMKKITKTYSQTVMADWLLLLFLWFAGITGFWTELAVTFDISGNFNQIILILHIIISMELVLLFAFSKFAHAIYRPVALMFLYSNEVEIKKK